MLRLGQGESNSNNSLKESNGKETSRNDYRRRSSARTIPIPVTSKRPSISLNSEFDLSNELTSAIMESDKALLVEAKKLNDVAGMNPRRNFFTQSFNDASQQVARLL